MALRSSRRARDQHENEASLTTRYRSDGYQPGRPENMAGAGAKKDPATEAVAVVPGGDKAKRDASRSGGGIGGSSHALRTERVDNVMAQGARGASTSTEGTAAPNKSARAARRRRREAAAR